MYIYIDILKMDFIYLTIWCNSVIFCQRGNFLLTLYMYMYIYYGGICIIIFCSRQSGISNLIYFLLFWAIVIITTFIHHFYPFKCSPSLNTSLTFHIFVALFTSFVQFMSTYANISSLLVICHPFAHFVCPFLNMMVYFLIIVTFSLEFNF